MIQKDLQGNLWELKVKEALKDIPTIKSDLPISAYGGIDLDEFYKTIDRLNKIPNYDDLMKENNQLQSNWNSLREWLEKEIDFQSKIGRTVINGMTFIGQNESVYKGVLVKMNELEGKDKYDIHKTN